MESKFKLILRKTNSLFRIWLHPGNCRLHRRCRICHGRYANKQKYTFCAFNWKWNKKGAQQTRKKASNYGWKLICTRGLLLTIQKQILLTITIIDINTKSKHNKHNKSKTDTKAAFCNRSIRLREIEVCTCFYCHCAVLLTNG